MNRRSFIQSLAVAVGVVTLQFRPKEETLVERARRLGAETELRGVSYLEAGYIWAPYIPIYFSRVGENKPRQVHIPRKILLHPAEVARIQRYPDDPLKENL